MSTVGDKAFIYKNKQAANKWENRSIFQDSEEGVLLSK